VLGRDLGEGEGEDGQGLVARALGPVLGVEHELGVDVRVFGHLEQEVVDAAGARREHGVAASVELVVDAISAILCIKINGPPIAKFNSEKH